MICAQICLLNFFTVAPAINPELMDITQTKGGTNSFICQAIGEPAPTVRWYNNSLPLDVSNTMKYMISVMSINDTTISSTLTIVNIEPPDVGTYTCNATNVVSSDTSDGILTVNGELNL